MELVPPTADQPATVTRRHAELDRLSFGHHGVHTPYFRGSLPRAPVRSLTGVKKDSP